MATRRSVTIYSARIVLLSVSVPPSMRQAAGPLIENLPNVLTGTEPVELIARRPDTGLRQARPRSGPRQMRPHCGYQTPSLRKTAAFSSTRLGTGHQCRLPAYRRSRNEGRSRDKKEDNLLKLRKVEIVGFKSFCERTVVTFSGTGTTCIVGPNGCGKSNVVDAISWVLGEQSHKSLRAERMADCIFNGTTKRPPMGLAEVTITLEDPELAEAARFVLETAAGGRP